MRYYVNNGCGVVATGASRPIGGGLLRLRPGDGATFGTPTPEAPLKISVHRLNPSSTVDVDRYQRVVILEVIGVVGDELVVARATEGPDAECLPGDIVVAGVTAEDLSSLWDWVKRPGPPGEDGTDGRDGKDGKDGDSGPPGVGSFGLSMPSGFSVTNSPLTGNGVIDVKTTLTGLVKANGSGFVGATAGVDYTTPAQVADKLGKGTLGYNTLDDFASDFASEFVTLAGAQTITGVKTFGRITLTPDGVGDKITTTGKSLILEQTGDKYGATRLELANRDNFNGALFENKDLWLVDFLFAARLSGSRIVRAIRFSTDGPVTGSTEFIFSNPGLSNSFAIGDAKVVSLVPLELRSALSINRKAVTATPYNVATPDHLLAVTGPASGRSIVLPNSTTVGRLVIVKDEAGNAATHNITVSVASSGTIDGGANRVINANGGSLTLYHGAAGKWFVI